MIKKIKRAIYLLTHPWIIIDRQVVKAGFKLDDKLYLKLRFRAKMGYWPDFNNPQTFNEKINWLKLHDRNPDYTKLVDKYVVKEYVASIIGEEYIIPTIGVWATPEEIEWEKLPNQFVLKTTHGGGGGGVIICSNKKSLDIESATQKLRKSMDSDIYKNYREWPYKNVKKQIIAETFMGLPSILKPGEYEELKDYKFFCFNGKVRCFKVDFNRFVGHRANYFSPTGQLLKFGENLCPPDFNHIEQLPDNLADMINLAEKLAQEKTFLRIDLYNIRGKIYFGEITFSPAGGMGSFTDAEWDKKLGDYIKLPIK